MEWDPAEDAEVGCGAYNRRAKGDEVEIQSKEKTTVQG